MGAFVSGGRLVAMVAGGAGGLGAHIVAALAGAGYRVASVDRAAAAVPEGGVALAADLTAPGGAAGAVRSTLERFGRLDALVNAAGLFSACPTSEVTEDEWDRVLAVNLTVPFRTSQAAAPHLAAHGGGAIVNVSSVAGYYPRADQAAYGASKAGLEHLTRVLALDLAPHVRVNAVRPGIVETGMARAAFEPATLARWAASVPLKRLAQPQDIADAALYLLRAAHVTGQVLTVDGGQTINVVKP